MLSLHQASSPIRSNKNSSHSPSSGSSSPSTLPKISVKIHTKSPSRFINLLTKNEQKQQQRQQESQAHHCQSSPEKAAAIKNFFQNGTIFKLMTVEGANSSNKGGTRSSNKMDEGEDEEEEGACGMDLTLPHPTGNGPADYDDDEDEEYGEKDFVNLDDDDEGDQSNGSMVEHDSSMDETMTASSSLRMDDSSSVNGGVGGVGGGFEANKNRLTIEAFIKQIMEHIYISSGKTLNRF